MSSTISAEAYFSQALDLQFSPDDPQFNDLPQHVIMKIFNYLDYGSQKSARTTCRSWYITSLRPEFRNRETVCFVGGIEKAKIHTPKITDPDKLASSVFPSKKKPEAEDGKWFGGIKYQVDVVAHLRDTFADMDASIPHVSFSNCTITAKETRSFFLYFGPGIKSLTFSGSVTFSPNRLLNEIFYICQELVEIRCDRLLTMFVVGPCRYEYHLTNLRKLSFVGCFRLLKSSIEHMLEFNQCLRHLVFDHCDVYTRCSLKKSVFQPEPCMELIYGIVHECRATLRSLEVTWSHPGTDTNYTFVANDLLSLDGLRLELFKLRWDESFYDVYSNLEQHKNTLRVLQIGDSEVPIDDVIEGFSESEFQNVEILYVPAAVASMLGIIRTISLADWSDLRCLSEIRLFQNDYLDEDHYLRLVYHRDEDRFQMCPPLKL